ncbi:MAG: NYN domain-containing protein [Ruminococcaceae bacterium]|nr:NYN domain-containing protein [Oscillospiraceae bacterium]
MTKTAILVDGGFYKTRAKTLFGDKTAEERANELERYCLAHLFQRTNRSNKHEPPELYRIFYYDCPPLAKKAYHPYLKTQIDFSRTPLYFWMNTFLSELKQKRKFALRLGRLSEEQCGYLLTPETVKKLCNGKLTFDSLTENDFKIDIVQKGVDMKIGIDIASLAYKKQVNQIILISGDSDFVPAAKLARREGIDFILDPMQFNIKQDLTEHIDGIRSKVDYILSQQKGPANSALVP